MTQASGGAATQSRNAQFTRRRELQALMISSKPADTFVCLDAASKFSFTISRKLWEWRRNRASVRESLSRYLCERLTEVRRRGLPPSAVEYCRHEKAYIVEFWGDYVQAKLVTGDWLNRSRAPTAVAKALLDRVTSRENDMVVN